MIGKIVEKLDSKAIVTGKAIYTDDIAEKDALIVKILRSPYPFAKIKNIDISRALKLNGVELILTYKDVPKTRFTLAGQSYPEPSPLDMLILDEYIRYVGDAVAIIAADTEETAYNAMKRIRVEYERYEAVIDFEKSQESGIVIHNKENVKFHLPESIVGMNLDKNIAASISKEFGEDFDDIYESSDIQIDEVYYTQAQAQSMMETFRSFSYIDMYGRLVVVSSTQVPFHIKRQLARALEIPASKIRIIKPRVGGGFGAKQTSVTEIYVAIVSLITKKAAKIVYSREETFTSSNSRHKMKMRVKLGASKEGIINCIHIDTLSDQGAYGIHSFTTVGLTAEKTIPLYNKIKSAKFTANVVYTNKMPAGAFRGYGATQGAFAVESAVNKLSDILGIDPVEIRLKNIVEEGEKTLAFEKHILSSKLKECILKGKELFNWEEKKETRIEDERIISSGMAITMQGSGIANIDTSTVEIKLNEEGDITVLMSPTDVGTGTDTILIQMISEILTIPIEEIIAVIADTDLTPYDPGSYASSGAYVTGGAAVNASINLKDILIEEASKRLGVDKKELKLSKKSVKTKDEDQFISFKEIAQSLTVGSDGRTIIATGSFGSKSSPPPYMASFCEIETDIKTGKVKILDFVSVVDCGKVINPALARVQVEGGIVQGIGLALYEDVKYSQDGKMLTNSFLQYKIPTREDICDIRVDFEESYEPTGPFGAKSIGEIVINTPAPAIAAALHNATGNYFNSLPMDIEDIYNSINK